MKNNSSFRIELEHAMGYNGYLKDSLILHTNLIEYIYVAGGVIIIAELNDLNKQALLRGHDDDITAINLSYNGRLLASGKININNNYFKVKKEKMQILLFGIMKEERLNTY